MRTTVTLDDDVAAAVEEIRHRRGVRFSTALNELVRRGLTRSEPRAPFVQTTSRGHARIDVSNVAEVLDLLDEPGDSPTR